MADSPDPAGQTPDAGRTPDAEQNADAGQNADAEQGSVAGTPDAGAGESAQQEWVPPASAQRAQRIGGWFTVVGAALLIVFFGIQTALWWERQEWLWVVLGIFIIVIDLALIVQFFVKRAGKSR